MELVAVALELAQDRGSAVDLIVFSEGVDAVQEGVRTVFIIPPKVNESFDSYAYKLADLAKRKNPNIILAVSGTMGKSVLAVTAGLLCAGLTADCIELAQNDRGELLQTRTAFGGKLLATIVTRKNRPQMATVLCSGEFSSGKLIKPDLVWEDIESNGSIHAILTERHPLNQNERVNLQQSKIIIAGGAGIGSKENFEYLYQAAKHFNAEVAASRAAVNLGYAPYCRQVGQSGQTVMPDIYIALGISGAVQHLSGMHNARCIIAVNNDPKAQIFEYADLSVVCDWKEYLEELVKQ